MPIDSSGQGGTLDHVLPKARYACFSVFGLNLVPCCDYNVHWTEKVFSEDGGRILHPYFDDILAERLLVVRFVDLGPVPRITIEVALQAGHPAVRSVEFHLENTVLSSAILAWMQQEWLLLVRRPSRSVRYMKADPATRAELVSILEEE